MAIVAGTRNAVPPSMPEGISLIPGAFTSDMCAALIERFSEVGGTPSTLADLKRGEMVVDASRKLRDDADLGEGDLLDRVFMRVRGAILPAIAVKDTRPLTFMERRLIARYSSRIGGHCAAHRDNDFLETRHRRYAVTVALNTGYEGGELCFPEFRWRASQLDAGTAVVFPCALLHQVTPVTSGDRYVFLFFLHDTAAERARIDRLNGRFAYNAVMAL